MGDNQHLISISYSMGTSVKSRVETKGVKPTKLVTCVLYTE